MKPSLVVLVVLQVVAILLYPPSFIQQAPQAAVLPPALLLLLILGIVGLNTNTLSQEGARSLLIFVQGLNLVVRLMTTLPNLKTPAGEWSWALLVTQLVAMGLAWYTMVAMEHRPLDELRLRKTTDA
jgi:ABC-type uncharacterized transport system permease subunit